jgi:hypothetical protein
MTYFGPRPCVRHLCCPEDGNFSEYYSDMDCIVDDQLWTPEDLEGARGLFAWGPPPPPSFLHPEDLAAMMTGAHAPR